MLRLEPLRHALKAARLVVVKRGGVGEGLVEDGADGRGVFFFQYKIRISSDLTFKLNLIDYCS